MKKAFKIIGIVFIVLLLALIVTPYAFRGKLMELTKQEINNTLTAKVDFDGFGVSIFKNFPDLTVTIKQLEIVGTEQFSKDTLISVDKLLATVDIMSVISGDSIGVKQIEIVKPRIHALIAADSSANYDIMKSSDVDTLVEVDTSTTKFAMQLEKISIVDAYIYYGDIPANMSATLDGMNLTLDGNFTEQSTLINTVISIAKLSYKMDGISYLKDVDFNLTAGIEADFEAFKFTLKENKMSLNDLDLEYNGWLAMPGDDIEMDFTCKTLKTDFKNILSLVPGVFMEGFEDMKTTGKLALEASLKGVYSESPETYPSFDIALLVENGMFKYPDLPKSVDNIFIDLRVSNPSNNLDSTIVDLKKFSMQFAQNPFSLSFFMKTPMTDPFMKANMSGVIDLESMKDFIPLDSTTMKGIIKPELQFAAKLSDVENENYSAITALGKLDILNLYYKDADVPTGLTVSNMDMTFSPQFVDVQQCNIIMGKSDVSLSGKLTNVIAYVMSDQTIKGALTLKSKFFDVNEIMGEDTSEAADTSASDEPYEIIEVPGNIDFVLQSSFGRLLYDTYDLTNVEGKITIKDRKISMDKLSMNLLGGSMLLTGFYATPLSEKPQAKFTLDIKNFDVAQTFKTFNTVQQLAPIAKHLNGTFSTKFDFSSILQNDFMPDMKTINGFGEVSAAAMGMKETSLQTFAASNLKQSQLKDIIIKNVLLFFTIEKGALKIKPFETSFNGIKTIIEGTTSIDQAIDYKIAMQIPRNQFGGQANSILNSLSSSAASKGVDASVSDFVDLTILSTGTVSNPKFKPVLGNLTSGVFNSVKDQAKQRLQHEAQAKLDAAKLQAQQEADRKKKELEAKAQAEKQKQTAAAKKEVNKQTDALKKDAKKQLDGVLKK